MPFITSLYKTLEYSNVNNYIDFKMFSDLEINAIHNTRHFHDKKLALQISSKFPLQRV